VRVRREEITQRGGSPLGLELPDLALAAADVPADRVLVAARIGAILRWDD